MFTSIVVFVGLLIAGFSLGRRPRALVRSPDVLRRRQRVAGTAALIAVAIPIGLLMMAKLFQSDVLGWMFGLSLMLGFALLPCAAVFGAGMLIGSRSSRSGAKGSMPAALVMPVAHASTFTIHLDRDCVHASDDGDTRTITADASSTLASLLTRVRDSGYLPSISGGNATWIVESSGSGGKPIGVLAQQWAEPRLSRYAGQTLAAHFGEAPARIEFKYWTQIDPELTYSRIVSGGELPLRH